MSTVLLNHDACRPPVQKRGRETLGRILDASTELLQTRLFDEISISEILEASKVAAGSFYARFKSKDDILPVLLHRYELRRSEYFSKKLNPKKWIGLTLEETVYRLVKSIADFFRDHSGMIRAFVMYYRARPELFSTLQKKRVDLVYKDVASLILRHRVDIKHVDPDKATREMVAITVSATRDKILFEARPYYSQTIPHERLIKRLSHLMYASLILAPVYEQS